MVNALIFILLEIDAFIFENTQMIKGLIANEVYLVKRDQYLTRS